MSIVNSKTIKINRVYDTNSTVSTKRLGKKLAQWLLTKKPLKTAVVISLAGDLGSGKTTFLQGMAKGLGINERITSPTFVILKCFKVNNLAVRRFNNFFHIDCYRIQKSEEILELGFKEIIARPQNIVAIEWPEKIKKFLPKETFWLDFQWRDKNKRKITMRKHG